MFDPIALAQQERNKEAAIALQRRLNQQKGEDDANTLTGFWQRHDSDEHLHEVRLLNGGVMWCASFHPTGFEPDQIVTVARSAGSPIGTIRTRR